MLRRTCAVMLAMVGLAPAAAAQTPARVPYDSAAYAWQAGRYGEALERLERLLTGPARDSLLAPIALLTGELYRTREIAPDAADPRWSPDAGDARLRDRRRLGTALRAASTSATSGPLRLDTLPGYAATFAPDGSEIAYIAADGRRRWSSVRCVGRRRSAGWMLRPIGLAPVYATDSRTAAAARRRRPVVADGRALRGRRRRAARR